MSRYSYFGSTVLSLLMPVSLCCAEDLSTPTGRILHGRRMAEGLELFKSEVRGILEKNCLECHGGEKVKGDLDLSSRELLLESGLVGETADDSDLMDSITHSFEPYMPHKRDKLDDAGIEAIGRWIDLGAPYDRPLVDGPSLKQEGPMIIGDEDRNYWAYRTLGNPKLPNVSHNRWPRTGIDRFILAKLETKGLAPNEEADRHTLIRRAFLNTIGLPPTTEEVSAYLNDAQPKAYERMIDRLLESPHYGERWARHWMDIARFAESFGFEIDFDRPYAYHYRDFLIKAFNRNMPYDQFLRWQIAGDELAPEEPQALMATGFMGAGPFPTVLTEHEFESARYDELDDMVSTLSTAMLGTTFGCARCHDHKYDPITSRDYYQLASIFTHTVRTYIDYDPVAEAFEKANEEWMAKEQVLSRALNDYEAQVLETPFRKWLEKAADPIPGDPWIVLSPDTWQSREGATLEKQLDDSILVSGINAEQETAILFFEVETSLQNIAGLRMETLTHPWLANNGPGRDHEGGLTIRNVGIEILDLGNPEANPVKVELAAAEATCQENEESLSAGASINGVTNGWSPGPEGIGQDQALVIRFAEPVGFAAGSRLLINVASGFNIQQQAGRPRFSITQKTDAPVEVSPGVPVRVVEGLGKLQGNCGIDDLREEELFHLRRWYGRNDAGWRTRYEILSWHHLLRPKSTQTRIMASTDGLPPIWHRDTASKGFPSFYKATHFLERGDVSQKGPVADPAFPQVLVRNGKSPADFQLAVPEGWNRSGYQRASLANWLTDVENGAGSLAARVFVNRIWHHHFGRGIVATTSDFGHQGEDPTHPELLEWLARDFVDHGWDIKQLQRQILNSAVYRESASFDPGKSKLDVTNQLLWHWPSRRMEAEVVRDSLLYVSGLLDPTPYGPGSRDPDMRRRSIYFFIKRSALIPEMLVFDWPEHLVGIGQRPATTVAPQALLFLNSPQVRKYAVGFAHRLADKETPEEKIKAAYQIALGRFPEAEELQLGLAFLELPMDGYAEEDLALVDYCQTLLCLNEFLYIR